LAVTDTDDECRQEGLAFVIVKAFKHPVWMSGILPWHSQEEISEQHTLLQVDRAKVLSNTIKQKRKQKAGKWEVPLPKVGSVVNLDCSPLPPAPKQGINAWQGLSKDTITSRRVGYACTEQHSSARRHSCSVCRQKGQLRDTTHCRKIEWEIEQ